MKKNKIFRIFKIIKEFLCRKNIIKTFDYINNYTEAKKYASLYTEKAIFDGCTPQSCLNPLRLYFDKHTKGHGIWKWRHYFDIYHRHFSKYCDQKVNILEIGIYSGGSLEMWRSYFGSQCHIYGVDIEEACKVYNNEYTSVVIGDQADPLFWQKFKQNVQGIDILIDDGGHTPQQQKVTL